MKSNFVRSITKIFILVSFFFSCSSDLDFDQANNFKLEPVFVANLAYFNLPASEITDNGQAQVAIGVSDFDVFKDKFFNEHLKKAEFNYEIENTINRGFSVAIMLLDADDQVLDVTTFRIPAYAGSSNIIKYPTEVFEGQRLELLKQSRKISFIIRIDPGPPLTASSPGILKLRSSATVYMEIE